MSTVHTRISPITIDKVTFRDMGYRLVDALSEFYEKIDTIPVTKGEGPSEIQAILGNQPLPADGLAPLETMNKALDLMTQHSLFNGHPKFLGYITSSPTQIGALADFLASGLNPNVGANILSPMATAIEKQTVRWLAELVGLPSTYGGVLVSGGNMANMTAFLAARTAKAPKILKEKGLPNLDREMVFYCSKATHTWIEKTAVLFGHGLNAMRYIPTDNQNRMLSTVLLETIVKDLEEGKQPFLVVGNAGDVSTGATDNLADLAAICKQFDLWFHVDGAYGVPAACVPECNDLFSGLGDADSIAIDPHKWLYAPLEVGCTLIKDVNHLINAYSSHPVYYNFDSEEGEQMTNFYEYSLQNSRGFRALKVWMAVLQVGRKGYQNMISEDISVAKFLFAEAQKHPELEAVSQQLSITTLRYVPPILAGENEKNMAVLNELNENLLNELQRSGEVFLSNAVIGQMYCLRACVVNYRTSYQDMTEIIDIILKTGRKLFAQMQGNIRN